MTENKISQFKIEVEANDKKINTILDEINQGLDILKKQTTDINTSLKQWSELIGD